MIIAIQPLGPKPPLFFIHGLIGIMTVGHFLAEQLGPEQPFYAVQAPGIGDDIIPTGRLVDMVKLYTDEIQQARPEGNLIIAGMCTGSLAAIEVARELESRGRTVIAVILADPPTVPPGLIPQNQQVDPTDRAVTEQLYARVKVQLLSHASQPFVEAPFDTNDPAQLHRSTQAGAKSLAALSSFAPRPFSGPTAVILTYKRAAGFFHPQMHWNKLLEPKPLAIVLACGHREIFRSARFDFVRALAIILEEAPRFGKSVEAEDESADSVAFD